MTIPTIDALPTPPSRNDPPATFVTNADAFLAALPTFRTQANAMAGAMDTIAEAVDADATAAAASAGAAAGSAAGAAASANAALNVTTFVATSNSSVSPTSGSKAFTLNETSRAFLANDAVVAVHRGDASVRLYGTASSYVGNVLTVSVPAGKAFGSGGPYTDWVIYEGAMESLPAADAATVRGGIDTSKAAVTAALFGAAAPVAVAYAATLALDLSTGVNFDVGALTGNLTLANPSGGMTPGRSGRIRIPQDGTGGRTISYGTWFKASGGAQSLSTAAGAVDCIYYFVRSATEIEYTMARAFS